jgi:ubiquinone/menaquinone biosynthesis C-methylase UbiE
MSKIRDANYLKTCQYKDSSKLSKRATFHERYATNTTGWQNWVFNLIELPKDPKVLEIGSGPGYLWKRNITAVPKDWQLFLTDLSPGMLFEARNNLANDLWINYCVLDANQIPFAKHTFDGVIANHMLYHVENLFEALKTIYDVLRPGGKLFAATNGLNHLVELRKIENIYFDDSDQINRFWADVFNLDNGEEILSKLFDQVECHRFPNKLQIPFSQPILDYLESKSEKTLKESDLQKLRKFLDAEIKNKGPITITSEGGLFICQKT